ncbi:flavin reductase family protein [Kineosporia babensis]|uniref:Flavin reductase family protein n=1 Tax=Kineosporia babensis TaxID=499548 RepID=A0A9X1NMR6_9ACTN|nr:flavin reductase family protein [Kineosporia babensis]MCD5316955.1 flavin reductase family protein [Kineosporia babensis]
MPVDAKSLRQVGRQVPSSVAVVTTGDGLGVTVGSLGVLSQRPPLVMFSLTRGSRGHCLLNGLTRFRVNVLAEEQAWIGEHFAQGEPGDRDLVGLTSEVLPRIPGAVAHLECSARERFEIGDHTMVIGLLEQVDLSPGRPLVYWNRDYHSLFPVAGEPLAFSGREVQSTT